MTGYGEATLQDKKITLVAQLRSLNHRSLDIQLRLPREYLHLEEEIRQKIREKVNRGRIELFLARSFVRGRGRTLELDEHLARQFLAAVRRAQKKFSLKGEVDVSLLTSRPELFHVRDVEIEGRAEKPAVMRVIDAALKNLDHSRSREGRNLQHDIQSQVKELRVLRDRLTVQTRAIALRLRQAVIATREGDLASERNAASDGNFKGDIHEEWVRLKSHIGELARVVAASVPAGKKIDFLLQELQREFNTIGAKAPQLAVSRLVLEGKERVEKIREQAQNVE
jgi:uncharacterized protein (TIGR00255 family)